MSNSIRADIAIAGAGFVGQTLALTFARAYAPLDLKVVLVDREDPAKSLDASADARSFAITATSRNLLNAIGVWEGIAPHAQEMRSIKVTDSKVSARARPVLLQFGEEGDALRPSAHVVENASLRPVLHEAVQDTPALTQIYGEGVTGLQQQAGGARLTLAGGTEIVADLVVAADGRGSKLRTMAGIDTVGWDYGQHGIVCTIAHERPHNGCAEENFLPAGPFAKLPLPGNRVSLVWAEAPEKAAALVHGSDEAFREALALRFGTNLGRFELAGPRMSFPLTVLLAREYVRGRLALVGDAAHGVHPIAGLGFNLGTRDVAVLAEAVADAVRLGLSAGDIQALSIYERKRRFDAFMVAAASDGLNKLFSNDSAVLRALRDLGLGVVDKIVPLKEFFIDQAAGHNSPVPAIMRGE